MPVSGRELDALKIIGDKGGKASTHFVAQKLGLGTEYTRTICEGLGRPDYIDLNRGGVCQMTAKGWQELERKGWKPPGPAVDTGPKCPRCGATNKPGERFCASCMQYTGPGNFSTYTIR